MLDILRGDVAHGDVREANTGSFYSFEACLPDDMQEKKIRCKVTDFIDYA